MKTIELKDEEGWILGFERTEEQIKYLITQDEYPKMEEFFISKVYDIDLPEFEGDVLQLPNVRVLGLDGKDALNYYLGLAERFGLEHNLEEIYFKDTGMQQIPEFVLRAKGLKKLTLRNEDISRVPDRIYDLNELEGLHFQYTKNIKVLSDEIRNHQKLKRLDLWQSRIEYLSPELFLLPKIERISLEFSIYRPTREVMKAIEIAKEFYAERSKFWVPDFYGDGA